MIYTCTTFGLFVFFPWGIPQLQSDCVIRLSLGKLLVNLLQVVKRTNTPLISSTNSVVGRTMGFLGRGFDPHHPQ